MREFSYLATLICIGTASIPTLAQPVCDGSTDAFGYRCTPVSSPTFETPAGEALITGNNDVSDAVDIGFDFDFYGTSYSSVYVSTNGFLTFLPEQVDGCCEGGGVPNETEPNGLIAAQWSDLDASAEGTITAETVGTEPDRRFLVTWNEVPFTNGEGVADVQVVLFEAADLLEIRLGPNVASSREVQTIGIENADGSDGLALLDGIGATTPNQAWRIRRGEFSADAGGTYVVPEGAGSLTLDAGDSEGQITSWRWDFDGDHDYDDASGETVEFDTTGLDGPTDVVMGLEVTNTAGEVDRAVATIEVSNVAPMIVSEPTESVPLGSVYRYEASAQDPAGSDDPLNWELLEGPVGVAVDVGGVVTWAPTPEDAIRVYPTTLLVDDGDGGADQQVWNLFVRGEDTDADGYPDVIDNCPDTPNSSQDDTDGDGDGDECDSDDDDDAIGDIEDNCPTIKNAGQADLDRDGLGDSCDLDDDADFVPDEEDNCPTTTNPAQRDSNGNGVGDVCDSDPDSDGVPAVDDNCPDVENPDQADIDGDGVGDDCDTDVDGDGLSNEYEDLIGTSIYLADTDSDRFSDGVEDRNGTDPRDPLDTPDRDGDGLDPEQEAAAGTDPNVADSDVDGLNDGQEVELGTDPLDADSDDDGLRDGEEVIVYLTDPLLADTDGGGADDGSEAMDGTSPLDSSDDRVPGATPAPTDEGCRVVSAPNAGSTLLWLALVLLLVRLSRRKLLVLLLALTAIHCGSDDPSQNTPQNDGGLRPSLDGGHDLLDATDCEGQSCPDLSDIQSCVAAESRCLNANQFETCSEGGAEWLRDTCDVGSVCVEIDQGADCLEVVCRPGDTDGCLVGDTYRACNDSGTEYTTITCDEGLFCVDTDQGSRCNAELCTPGQTRCQADDDAEICSDDGKSWVPGRCSFTTVCDAGICTPLCEVNSKVTSFLGCDYWSVDFDNIEEGTEAAHAVVISNPSDSIDAEVEITRGSGDLLDIADWDLVIPPGELRIYRFDGDFVDAISGEPLLNTRYVSGTVLGDQSFRVSTSIPTTAHQFNPLVDVNVFTNDASLLLPTNAGGTEYLVMGWNHRSEGNDLAGFVAVIAFAEDTTTVDVTPTADVRAGLDRVNGGDLAGINAGETQTFELEAGQFIYLASEGPAPADITGTEVTSDEPVIVFGGHACANIPGQLVSYCDHIEQQMFPVPAWGRQYVVTSFVARAEGDAQIHRIMASRHGTIVTTIPPQPDAVSVRLDRGEYVQFRSAEDFEVSASAPVLVGQYMTGSTDEGGGEIGDPAFALAVPVVQWRTDYIVLTPPAYDAGDYLNIVTTPGNEVELDDELVEDWETVGDGFFVVARVAVEDGVHTLSAEAPFGVVAYGYDTEVSYAYPGGLNLEVAR